MRWRNSQGYTLTEMLVVVVLIGIVLTVSTMSLFGLLQRQRVRAAANVARNVIRLAQTQAMKERRVWTAAFRNGDQGIEYRIYRDDKDQTAAGALPPWQPLLEDENDQVLMVMWGTDFYSPVRDEREQKTLECWQDNARPSNECRVSFNYQGKVITPITPRRISFSLYGYEGQGLHCVRLATLVGGVRVESGIDKCGKYGD